MIQETNMLSLLPLRKPIIFNLVFHRMTALANLVLRVTLIGTNTAEETIFSELISNEVYFLLYIFKVCLFLSLTVCVCGGGNVTCNLYLFLCFLFLPIHHQSCLLLFSNIYASWFSETDLKNNNRNILQFNCLY